MSSSSSELLAGGALVLRALLALVPVQLFLLVLHLLDSFRLVSARRVLGSLLVGGAVAGLAYGVNNLLLWSTGMPVLTFALLVAPLVEESGKAAWLEWQVATRRTGFLIDATILAFATGAGFATVENLYYLRAWPDAPWLVWAVRGLGTAVMHGGAATMYGLIRQAGALSGRPVVRTRLLALAAAVVFHGAFNSLMGHAVPVTLGLLVLMVLVLGTVLRLGQNHLRAWLGRGLDRDRELLATIRGGEVRKTPLGFYLMSLRDHFGAAVVTDMLCLLRLEAELSIRAKGTLMLREHGFAPAEDPDLAARLAEHRWLARSIGRAGLWALAAVRPWHGQAGWQRRLLATVPTAPRRH